MSGITGFIYLIKCAVNGKIYIGITTDSITTDSIRKRWNKHVYGGYNETFGGEAPMLGKQHSQKTRQLISKKMKGKPSPNKGKTASIETRRKLGESHSKSVMRINSSGNVIAVYKSVTAASQATGIAGSNISGVCRGKKKTAGGFCWQYTRK
ncbi:MAG: NUMOD3 domain-containing DNA-binding protein [Nitrosotalea sp.]